MDDTCVVWALWRGNRNETPEDCARYALAFLEELTRIDPVFTRFETTSRKRGKYVDSPVPLELEGLTALFAKGVLRNTYRKVMASAGYTLHAMTPGKSRASLMINGGCFNGANSCGVKLDFEGDDYERFVNIPVVTRILGAIVKVFRPDLAAASFFSFEEAMASFEERRDTLDIGWLMYFSREWGIVPPLPAPVRMEPLGDGVLIILSPERVSASNPADVELGRRVRGLLNKAGLLDKHRFHPNRPPKP